MAFQGSKVDAIESRRQAGQETIDHGPSTESPRHIQRGPPSGVEAQPREGLACIEKGEESVRLPVDTVRSAVGPQIARAMERLVAGALRPLLRRAGALAQPNPSGRRFCVIHLDGVSRRRLLSAIEAGQTPFLGRLMRSEEYALSPCYSGAPASTPAFQAGLLYGLREPDIPGFLWYDRERRAEVHMDCAADAAEVEARLRAQRPGLLEHGTASFSVFTGGAAVNGFTMAGWATPPLRLIAATNPCSLAAGAVAHAHTAARIASRLASEGSGSLIDGIRHSARLGRLQHEPTFFLHRVGLSIGAREAAIFRAALDLARGVPAIYTCFGDYDEIAHRRGPDGPEAVQALRGIDEAAARIFAAAAAVPELGYDLYVVSDHGQVHTRPFEGTIGLGLLDYLALAEPRRDGAPRVSEEATREIGRVRALARAAQGLPAALEARARSLAREAARAIARRRGGAEDGPRLLDEAVCVEAGDIAHLYLGGERRALVEPEIARRFSRLLAVVTRCPLVGLVAARIDGGAVAYVSGRRWDLRDPGAARALELGYGGARALAFVKSVALLPSAGDLVVYGNGLPGEDVAFPWEFGSHAGVARDEVETFIIHPREVPYDFTRVSHGADLHDFLVDRYFVARRSPTVSLT